MTLFHKSRPGGYEPTDTKRLWSTGHPFNPLRVFPQPPLHRVTWRVRGLRGLRQRIDGVVEFVVVRGRDGRRRDLRGRGGLVIRRGRHAVCAYTLHRFQVHRHYERLREPLPQHAVQFAFRYTYTRRHSISKTTSVKREHGERRNLIRGFVAAPVVQRDGDVVRDQRAGVAFLTNYTVQRQLHIFIPNFKPFGFRSVQTETRTG